MRKLPNTRYEAGLYAIGFCLELSGLTLKRRLHQNDGEPWATFYDASTKRRVFDCNQVFAETHFREVSEGQKSEK